MLREVFPHIYLNEIPLPKNPLKFLNSYILVSEKRNLIIDTGFNIEACRDAFMSGVAEIGVDLSRTDVLLTHMHADHAGLADELYRLGCRILIGTVDGDVISRIRSQGNLRIERLGKILGLGQNAISFNKPEFGHYSGGTFDFVPIAEGDTIEVGTYRLQVIDTPGHTPGHICLFEGQNRILFSGDHILNDITPNITFWDYEFDSLGTYLTSLQKIEKMAVDLVLPAHRSLISDHTTRIRELSDHHDERLKEIFRILQSGKKTAAETAAQMHWDLSYKTWEEFPGTQKWFATGEAMSHLEYFAHRGNVRREIIDDTAYFQWVD